MNSRGLLELIQQAETERVGRDAEFDLEIWQRGARPAVGAVPEASRRRPMPVRFIKVDETLRKSLAQAASVVKSLDVGGPAAVGRAGSDVPERYSEEHCRWL